jgi:hypothetical protein
MGPLQDSGSYKDVNQIGRKNVCAMDNNGNPSSSTDPNNGGTSVYRPEMQELINKRNNLISKIGLWNSINTNLNDTLVRGIAFKLDNGLSLNSQDIEC